VLAGCVSGIVLAAGDYVGDYGEVGLRAVEKIINDIIVREGGFVNHPSDKGGPTKYGITQATLSAYRGVQVSVGEVRNLTRFEAYDIYYRRYVVDPGFFDVLTINEDIAAELIDAAVLSGEKRPIEWLQTALNKFNRGGRLYADIAVDGSLGPVTLRALRAYLAARGAMGPLVMVRALDSLQGAFFVQISKAREANQDFIFGWFSHRIGNVGVEHG